MCTCTNKVTRLLSHNKRHKDKILIKIISQNFISQLPTLYRGSFVCSPKLYRGQPPKI